MASSGPKKAPKLSPMPSNPKALPLFSSDTEDAIRASRGAERMPVPSRSRKRAAKTPCQIVDRPINGFATADEGDRLSFSQPIRQPARSALDDILGGLGDAVDQADDTAARVQCLGQKNRQERIKHFR